MPSDDINKVIDNLFVGSLEAASSSSLLEKWGITSILSIGCSSKSLSKVDERLRRKEFPEILDNPEVCIAMVLEATTEYIQECLDSSSPLLVHCVYGQSRSVAVIVGYLMSAKGMTFDTAIRHMQMARPCMCLNPGFLSQLYCLSLKPRNSAEIKLLTLSSSASSAPSYPSKSRQKVQARSKGTIYCNKISCGYVFGGQRDTVRAIDYEPIFDKYLDSFWKGYKPIHPGMSKQNIASIPLAGYIAIGLVPWLPKAVLCESSQTAEPRHNLHRIAADEKSPPSPSSSEKKRKTASLDTEDSDKAVASKTQHVDKSYAKKLQTGILQSKATRKAEALRLRHQKQPMAIPASTQSIIGGKIKYAADTGQSEISENDSKASQRSGVSAGGRGEHDTQTTLSASGSKRVADIAADKAEKGRRGGDGPEQGLGQRGAGQQQAEEGADGGLLRCPGCGVECGLWRRHGLALCAGFVLVPLIALEEAKVRVA